jgi:hypothetical protein
MKDRREEYTAADAHQACKITRSSASKYIERARFRAHGSIIIWRALKQQQKPRYQEADRQD